MNSFHADSEGFQDELLVREWWQINREKGRNLCEALHLSVRDWQTISTVIHQGVVLIHLTGQLMETIWQENQGWFHVSREGGKVNANKMSASIKCEWQPSVFHWQRIYNNPANGAEPSPSAHRRPKRRCIYLPQVFYCVLLLSSTLLQGNSTADTE